MRVFISADIEGTTFTTVWDDTRKGELDYPAAAQQMTAEVKAACEGAIAAGAEYILVKDAHSTGRNIDIHQLPKCCELIRAGNGRGVFQKSGYIEKSNIVHGSYVFVVTDASGNTETKEKSTDFENIKEISNFIYTINNEEFYPNSSTDHVTFTFDCIAPSEEGVYLEENKYNISFTLNVVENEAFGSGLFYDTKNLGIAFYGRDRSFGEVIVFAAESTGENALLIYKALGMLFTPEGLNNVGGPIAMFQMSSLAMSLGISSFFFLWGVISINLAVMNFLPIPGLDGWHFLVLIVEAITRKEMPKNAKNIASMIGLILLFGLMIVITFKDIFTLIF